MTMSKMFLLRYSEWLDTEGLIVNDNPLTDDSGNEIGELDERTHEDLVKEFLASES